MTLTCIVDYNVKPVYLHMGPGSRRSNSQNLCFFTKCSPCSCKETNLSSNATCYITKFHQNLTVAIVCVIYLHVSAYTVHELNSRKLLFTIYIIEETINQRDYKATHMYRYVETRSSVSYNFLSFFIVRDRRLYSIE